VGKGRLAALIAAAGFGILMLGYGAAYAFTGDKIPGDTTVLGIKLGGMSQDEAKVKLAAGVKDRLDDNLKLTAGGKTYPLKPSDAGLTLDVDTTGRVAGAARSLSPGRIWHVLTGGAPVEPVVTADPAKLNAVVQRLAKRIDQSPTEGSITFTADDSASGAKAVRQPSAEGRTLDKKKAADAIVSAYPSSGTSVALPVHRSNPKVNAEALDKAMTEFAEPAVSGPIRLTVDDQGVTLTPKQLAPALKLVVKGDDTYTPSLDMAKLEPVVEKEFEGIETLPEDATIEIRGGRPTVVPAVDGMVVDRSKVGPAILSILPKPAGQRTAAVGLVAKKAEFTTEQATKLGVKEVIGEFTTYFPHAAYRNTNIGMAARKINGTLLKPGEIFSLNRIVGERTEENGFTTGYIINHGVLEKDLGGGVSQSATTTFNAMFFAGFKDIQHKPHSFYISRYPEGREATVAWPSVDLKFQNDSRYGALVTTSFHASSPGNRGSITVRIWGTKTWDITAGKSARYNPTQAGTIYNDKPGCETHPPEGGFDVKVYRYFNRNGVRIKTETFTTHYNPADRVVCGKKPTPTPTPPMPPSTPPSR
jgi:vancomycin resistance protein YoaR